MSINAYDSDFFKLFVLIGLVHSRPLCHFIFRGLFIFLSPI